MSFALISPATKRPRDPQTYLDRLCQGNARIARAHTLVQACLAIVRERRSNDLEAWMAEATYSGIDELARFAHALVKLLKRQGYGRAGFTLLWQRVLQAS